MRNVECGADSVQRSVRHSGNNNNDNDNRRGNVVAACFERNRLKSDKWVAQKSASSEGFVHLYSGESCCHSAPRRDLR